MIELDLDKEKLTIRVEPGATVDAHLQDDTPPNGILPGAIPRRRVFPRKKSGGILSFYDFTLEKVGSDFVSRNLSAATATPALALPFLNAPLSDHPRSQWASKYKKIQGDAAEVYRISVGLNDDTPKPLDGSNSAWRDTSLLMPKVVNRLLVRGSHGSGEEFRAYYEDAFLGCSLFPDLEWITDTGRKITALPDVDSPAVPFKLDANKPANVFLNPDIFAVSFSDDSTALPDHEEVSEQNPLPYPAYRWIFTAFGPCSAQPTGSHAYFVIILTSGGSLTSEFVSKIRVWDRNLILANPLISDNGNILSAEIVKVLGLMGESKTRERFTVIDSGYLFGVEGDGGTFGQALCGDTSGFTSTDERTNVTEPDSFHGNSYAFNSTSGDIAPAGSLAGVVNQGAKWFYLWNG